MDAGGADAQAAFADAVARAKQIAAKINQPGSGSGDAGPMKRPFEGDNFGEPDLKKSFAGPSDHFDSARFDFEDPSALGNNSKGFDNSGPSAAAAAAQAAAARINQQLGVTSSGSPSSIPKPGPHAGLGMVVTEEYAVPDRMVGLIIGKGGEQITRLQAETGCKIQIAPDSGGMPDRPCTLTGTAGSIAACKQQIQDIIQRGQSSNMGEMGGGGSGGGGGGGGGGGQNVVEIMVPGNKVGLVIGKGGETIKMLQERAGVKMVMIQDSNTPTAVEKPLRISGDPIKCARAREMVMDLLTEKELEVGFSNNMSKGGYNDYGSNFGGNQPMEIPVPRGAVGIIIGKGGEMIKKIQTETGAKVQFKPDDGSMPDRICSIQGAPDKVQNAVQMIQGMLNDYSQREGPGGMGRGFGGGRGRGGPSGRGRGGPFGGPGGMGRGNGGFGGGFPDETTFSVPADKCGLVIGKGGETIRQINQQSGAHVELQRNPGPNPNEKVFNLRGDPDQINHAMQLIAEKAGIPFHPGGPGGPGPGGPGGPGPHGGPGGPGGGPGYGDQFGGQFGGPGQQGPGPQYGGPQGGWGGGYGQQQQQGFPQQQGGDPSAADPNKGQDNAAAWAAYYAQYYAQYGQGAYNMNQYNQQQGQQQPAATQQPAQQPQQQQGGAPAQQPSINPATGQPDYSAAWAEYYRQQGMHYQANLILQQAQQGGGGQGGPAPGQQPQ